MTYRMYIYYKGFDVNPIIEQHKLFVAKISEAIKEYAQGKQKQGVVLERLATCLLRRYPFSENTGLWLGVDPIETVLQLSSPVWTLEIDPGRSEEFLRELLPLIIGLRLTFFDPQLNLLVYHGFYSYDKCIYPPSALTNYPWLKLESANADCTKSEARKYLIKKIDAAFAESGFQLQTKELYDIYFYREIENGHQEITGRIKGTRGLYSCSLEITGLVGVQPTTFCGLQWGTYIGQFRILKHEGWYVDLVSGNIATLALIDWLVEDLVAYGTPILEKAQTEEDVDWLYNSPEASDLFPGNHVRRHTPVSEAKLAITAAKRCGNPNLERIVDNIFEWHDAYYEFKQIEKFIDECLDDIPTK